jgi:hexosaminidase
MSWRGTSAGMKAAAQGNNVIMAPRQFCYFDYPQDWDDEKKAFFMIYLPIDKVYSFDPAAGVKGDQLKQHILGGEACVWTEYIDNAELLQYQAFPRIVAMAECLWTKKSEKKYSDFEKRLRSHKNYFLKEKDAPPVDLIHFKTKNK